MPSLDKPYSYRWPISVGLVLVASYTLYVFEQYRELHNLNQRELAMAAQQLRRTVENAVVTVENAVEAGKDQSTSKDFVCDFVKEQPYLALDPEASCKTAKPSGTAELVTEGGLRIKADKVVFNVGVGAILGDVAFPEAFGLVFLAREDGKVLYQEAPGSQRWLGSLPWSERELRPPNPAVGGPIAIIDLKEMAGSKPVASTTRLAADIAGDSYQVYLHPVAIDGTRLVMGGAAPTRELFRSALQVDTYFTAAMTLVLLAGLLGVPFVKLWSLNRRERFRLSDVHLLYLGSAALLALSTTAIMAAESFGQYRLVADDGLRGLADNLSSNFIREVGAALRELTDADDKIAAMNPDFAKWKPEGKWFEQREEPKPTLPPTERVNCEQLAWVGKDGKQAWKITTDNAPELVQVDKRPYVRMVRQRPSNLYRLAADQSGDETGRNFYLGPSRSITDGKFYTFLSKSSRIVGDYIAVATLKLVSVDRQPLPAGYGFAVINREGTVLYHSDTRLSLRENILEEVGDSAEFRSHLIAGRGGWIASSYRERKHRFYVKPLTDLRRVGDNSLSLFLLTFRDTSGEVATFAYVFLLIVGPLAGLLMFLAAGLFVVERVSRGAARAGSCPPADRLGTWLWPQDSLQDHYRRFSGVLGILLATMLAACPLGGWIVWLAAPPIVLILGIALHRRGVNGANTKARRRMSEPVWNLAQWILTVVCIVGLPSAATFRLVLEHESGKLIQAEQNWIRQQETDEKFAARAAAADESYSNAIRNRAAELRSMYRVSPPTPFNAPTGAGGPLAKYVVERIEAMGAWIPISNDTMIRYRFQQFSATYAPPGRFGWGWPAVLVWPAFGFLLFALFKWISWNSRNMFLSDIETVGAEAAAERPAASGRFAGLWNWIDGQLTRGNRTIMVPENPEVSWEALKPDERFLMLQIAEQNLANPGRRREVEKLLAGGYLCLDPDLQPTPAFCQRVAEEAARPETRAALREWEQVGTADSWHYVRTIAFGVLAVLAVFLFQSEIAAIAGAVATVLANLSKLRDAIGGWFPSTKAELK